MKLRHIVVAALGLTSAGALAAANPSAADTSQQSGQSYNSSQQSQSPSASQELGQSSSSLPSSQGDNSQVSQIQQALNDMGLNAGPVDGKLGPKTKSAIKQFQQQKGLQASGKLDSQTVAMLTTGASGSSQSQGFFSPQGADTTGSTSSSSNGSAGVTNNGATSGNNGSTATNNGSATSPGSSSSSTMPSQDNGSGSQSQQQPPSSSGRT
jgi:peptidoglycan hydrolase-like protein with peptidoglycan-binding domain